MINLCSSFLKIILNKCGISYSKFKDNILQNKGTNKFLGHQMYGIFYFSVIPI